MMRYLMIFLLLLSGCAGHTVDRPEVTTGAPVVVMFTCKSGPGSYALELSRVIRVPRDLGRSGVAAAPYVAEFAEALEGFVEKYPYQFFNFFDLWNQSTDCR